MPFHRIYNLYYTNIYQFVYRLSLSRQDSEDISQEVFLSLYKEIEKKKTPDNAKAWLYKCALNKFINSNKRTKTIQFTDNIGSFEKESANTAETDLISKEKKQIVAGAISKLSEKEQILLNLFNDDFSYKEISEITDIKYTSVGKTLSRVIEKVAKSIKQASHEELFIERNII